MQFDHKKRFTMLIRSSPNLNKHDLEDRFLTCITMETTREASREGITKSVTLKVHSVCPVAKTLPTFSLHLCLPAATRRRIGSSFPPRTRTHVHLLCVPCIRNRSSLVSVRPSLPIRCRDLLLLVEFILKKTMSGIRGKRLVGMRVYTCVAICSFRLPDNRVVSIANEFSKE